jgi:sugar phosphate isomerase/epimerase
LPDVERSGPRLSISQISTLTQSFEDDLRTYADAGLDGIGIWEIKLPDRDDDETLERVRASGLDVTNCVAAIPSILPLTFMAGPEEPRERIEAFCASLHRLAPFRPNAVALLTGSARGLDSDDARATVVEGLRTIADEAERAGVRVGLEPVNRVGGDEWAIVRSIPEALELLDEADRPQLGLLFDTWHLWNTPTLFDDIEAHVGRLVGVHVSDWRDPTRSWADRVLPGDGVAGVARIVGALDRAGWSGAYDLEIFSDNGTFGSAYEDSLWDVPGAELARRGREALLRAWEERTTS